MRTHDVKEILIDKTEIARRVDELVDAIATGADSNNLVVVGILKGSFMFLADLMRSFHRHNVHPRIDFLTLSSYGSGTTSSGTVEIIHDIREEIHGANVLVVDDILDTGRTLAFTKKLLRDRGAKTVRSCVLLDKKAHRAIEFEADYAGFSIADHFVVGYGLDYNNLYRELPHIAKVHFHPPHIGSAMKATNLTAAACAALLGTHSAPAEKVRCYFGTTQSKGIYFSTLDTQAGTLDAPELAFEIDKPGFIVLHPSMPYLYSTTSKFNGGANGGVAAFKINADGSLSLLNKQSSEGRNPCHVSIDSTGQCLMVANYGSGSVASFAIREDGSLSAAKSTHQHAGSAAHPTRQKGPHAHSIFPDPSDQFAYASDLGIDKIMIYALNPAQATLTAPQFAVVPGGSMGPRHMKWSANGKYAYVLNELDVSISVFKPGKNPGSLVHETTLSALPEGPKDSDLTGAEIRLHPNGRFIYASIRDLSEQGRDAIAIFSRFEDGFHRLEITPAQVWQPRNFNLDPSGKWMLVCGQKSHDIALFKIDPTTGKITFTGTKIPFDGLPICVEFMAP